MLDRNASQLQKITEKVEQLLQEKQMLLPEGRIVAGVSGGADSMALLHFLFHRLSDPKRLLVAHVNHGLRGEEADRDEQFVKNWCDTHKIEFQCTHVDVRTLAQSSGLGEEACGREVRYRFFHALAAGDADRIATAHTLSDSCETLLLHVTSGAGGRGMSGIPAVRGKIIRPLLCLTREEVEAYCAYHQLAYVTDSTNAEPIYTRNRIRSQITPVLKSMNPAWEQAAARAMRSFAEDEACLCELAQTALASTETSGGYRIAPLQSLPDALLLRAVRAAAEKHGAGRMTELHLRACASCVRKGVGEVSLPGGISCRVAHQMLCFFPSKREKFSLKIPFVWPQTLTGDGRIVIIDMLCTSLLETEKKQHKFHNLLLSDAFDCDTITQDIVLRTRQEGDSFSPAGRGIRKSLRKLFNEAKLSAFERESALILESAGEIVWIEGFGVSEPFRITEKTVSAAKITVHRL